MGGLCCCFHVPDVQDNNASSNDCVCPKCLFQKFINKHRRRQTRAICSPNEQAASSNLVFFNNLSPERAVPNIASSRFLQEQQRNEARARQEKGTSRSQVQPEPVGQSDVQVKSKSLQGHKIFVSNNEVEGEFAYTFPSLDDEDACPTCFEEYNQENPKITMKCSHHYHLSCIYEWMERSENCPVCRKLMLFDESS